MQPRTAITLFYVLLANVISAQSSLYGQGMATKSLWPMMESVHKKNKATDSYTYKEFIYLANGEWTELDEPVIAALQAELPSGRTVTVIKDGTTVEGVRAANPTAHVFFFELRKNVMIEKQTGTGAATGSSTRYALDFKMHDESGSCQAVEVNHLICFPPDVIAKMLVKNVLQLHVAMGAFLDAGHKDHYADMQKGYLDDISSRKDKTLTVASTDLNVDEAAMKGAYTGTIQIMSKEEVYELIRSGADAYVLLAPDDGCKNKVEDTRVTNVKVLYHCTTGKCYVPRFPDVRKTFEGFGFTLADFQYLEKPKL